DHARVAIDILALPVVGDYFSPSALDGRTFDLVMLSHVIEHIYEPRSMIHMLLAVLKPGGVLVVVTPNASSYIARLSGRGWVMLRPTDHVSMISARAYDHFGLGPDIEVHHHGSEYPWEFVASLVAAATHRMAGGTAVAPRQTPAPTAAPSVMRNTGWR